MEREIALAAELFARADDAHAEDRLPETVHGHAGGERIVAADDPAGEAEAVLRIAGVPSGEARGHAFADFVAEGLPVAAELHEGLAALVRREVLHDRHRHRGALGDLLLEVVGEGALGLGRGRDVADVVLAEEIVLGLGAFFLRGVEGGLERFVRKVRLLGEPLVEAGQPDRLRLLEGCLGGGAILHPLVALGLHARRIDFMERGFVAFVAIGALVEERVGLEVFRDGDRVVLMGVALRAGHGGAHEYRIGRVDPVDDGGVAELFVAGAAFVLGHRVAMKGGRNDLVFGGVGEQVAGELLHRELVEGLVLIERLDHPVAVGPDDATGVAGVAGAVGITGEVEPLAGPVFAVGGLGEEVGDDFGVRGLAQPRDFLRRGREAGDVQRDAADQDVLGRFGRPLQAFLLLPFGEEGVHGIGFAVLRHGRTDDGFVGPVSSPDGALLDPFLEQRELRRRDGLVLLGRRHHVVGIRRLDALDEFALLGLAGQDHEVSFAVALGVLLIVEP